MILSSTVPKSQPPLNLDERKRRVLLLCCSFSRNLVANRVGRVDGAHLLARARKDYTVWIDIFNNWLDIAVLEWCKLFGELNGEHNWKKVVAPSTHKTFQKKLLDELGVSDDNFAAYIRKVREYRNKFLAHLDEERIMNIPDLKVAEASVTFLYQYLLAHECGSTNLNNLPTTIEQFHERRDAYQNQVRSVISRA